MRTLTMFVLACSMGCAVQAVDEPKLDPGPIETPSSDPIDMSDPTESTVEVVDSALAVNPGPTPPKDGPPCERIAATRTAIIRPVGDVTGCMRKIFSDLAARSDKASTWTVRFTEGTFDMTGGVYVINLQNVMILGDPARPATLRKGPAWKGEFMFQFRYGRRLRVQGLRFEGKTKVYALSNYEPYVAGNGVWGDQGLYFGSTREVVVERNRFQDFGNAALRVSTWDGDPVKGVNSFDTQTLENEFVNVFQITTTSNSIDHGGSANYRFERNRLVNLRGSVKFASRTAGARGVKILDNLIESSSADAFEICAYVDVEIARNKVSNLTRSFLNAYPPSARAGTGFDWGDDLYIHDNVATGMARALRFDFGVFNGVTVIANRVRIQSNVFRKVTNPSVPMLMILNGPADGLSITNNRLYEIASRRAFSVGVSRNVTISGNTMDDKPIP